MSSRGGTIKATRPRRDSRAWWALADRLAMGAEDLARTWCREAHVRVPHTEADLRMLTKRLQTPDELPDSREADETYLHHLKQLVHREVSTP